VKYRLLSRHSSLLRVALLVFCGAFFFAPAPGAQEPAATESGIIWKDPGEIETKDLFWGVGSEARLPKPPFKFLEEKKTGTVAKVVVEDANGDVWDVKLAGEETHPEVVANRLVWALGYPAEEMYFIHEGSIEGATNLERAAPVLKDGKFVAARFRKRSPHITEEEGGWAFDKNPFVGRQELSGLVILMALINNWDTADVVNKEVLNVKSPTGTTERWFIVQDLGASFGRFKGPNGTPIKWHLESYQQDGLIEKVDATSIVLNYPAFGTPPRTIPIEHARWFSSLIGRLSDEQLRAAFRAGGATDAEIDAYVQKLSAKIAELRNAVGGTAQP
jgi:hypothetical protein